MTTTPAWFDVAELLVQALVAGGTLALAWFTWRLAKKTAAIASESHDQRTQAEELLKLQREDFTARQAAAVPDLRLFDVWVDVAPGKGARDR